MVPGTLTGAAVRGFESQLAAFIRAGREAVLVDCSGLEPVTSRHISLLWDAQRECELANVRLKLEAPSLGLVRVLKALDLDGVFAYDSALGLTAPPGAVAPYPVDQSAVYSDAFAPTPEGIDTGITRFVRFLSQLAVPEITAYELRIVMYEVTTNIMCHSTLSPLDRIEMRAQAGVSGVTLQFTDSGVAFDPTAQETRVDYRQAAKDRRTRGFGLAMIRNLVDDMEYSRVDASSNVLTLKKRWETEQ
jgi:anti-sigma regulatory factor (Ser/Thr protein kinase)/anti-anti-sigma regulatory factor